MRVAAFALTFFFIAGSARAAIYENEIKAEDEDDLFEMQQRGDISDETMDTLIEILREGVDLNSADREQLYDLPGLTYTDVDAILEYRKSKGRIDDPTELVGAGAVTAEQLVQISPFIRIDAARPILPVSGKVHAQSRITTADNVPPPALLNARVKGPLNLSAGFMAFTSRRRAATPQYDPTTDALQSAGFSYTPHLPRFFAQWKPGNAKLIVGTFTVGFAERLTIDNTRRVTPRGIYLIDDYRRPQMLSQTCKLSAAGITQDPTTGCDLAEGKNLYITPDYTWREVFRGVAGSIEDLRVGQEGSLSLYGWLSYQSRALYQYELYDKRYCLDPNEDSAECKAPAVYLPDGTTRLVYSTLSNVFDEITGGAHVTYKPTYRVTLGVTGYGALPIFNQQTIQLDFQDYSRYPTGGAFGAIGVDAHTSVNGFNFFLEAAHNFDRRPSTNGAGGWGVEQRTTYSPKGQEFEISLRLYDPGFGTAYARPIASPDMLEGQRARNEFGARFRWAARLSKDWEVGLRANFWLNPWATTAQPAGIPNLFGLARVDFTGWSFFQPAVWIDARNRNLGSSEHGGCATGGDTIILTEGEPFTCSGDMYKIVARADVRPYKKVIQATLQAAYIWRDDFRYKDRFRNDVQLWLELRSQPLEFLQLRARTRYLDQDVSDPTYLETNLWSWFEATWIIGKGTRIAARYENLIWLDQRASTANRLPNPEHRFQLDVRAAF